MSRRRLQRAVLCVAALAALVAFTGCGKSSNKPGELVREGLSTPLAGLRYTVFLTRELNLRNEEDSGYLPGYKEAPPGRGLYGVFLQACNSSKTPAKATSVFYLEDSQGEKFSPVSLPRKNPFAYEGGMVPSQDCEPRQGSLAQQGPTSGAMLLFNLPLASTENRPITLHIENPTGSAPAEATVTLDI